MITARRRARVSAVYSRLRWSIRKWLWLSTTTTLGHSEPCARWLVMAYASCNCVHSSLHIVDGKIAELTGFDATDKPWLGLPPTLSSDQSPHRRRVQRT